MSSFHSLASVEAIQVGRRSEDCHNKHVHTCFAVRVVVVDARGQGGGLAAAGEGRAGGRGRHGRGAGLAAAAPVLGVLWRVHDLLEAVGTLVEDGEELCREGLQQLQRDRLVYVPEPVPALRNPLDLWRMGWLGVCMVQLGDRRAGLGERMSKFGDRKVGFSTRMVESKWGAERLSAK